MHNPHLDNLNLLDRIILFVSWAAIGFLSSYILLTRVMYFDSGGFELVKFPIVFSIFCGLVGAMWPHQIKKLIRGIWE